MGRINSRERRPEWMDSKAPQNARPEVASRAGNATPAAPYSAIGMPGTRRSDPSETRVDTPSPDPQSVSAPRVGDRTAAGLVELDASRRNGALGSWPALPYRTSLVHQELLRGCCTPNRLAALKSQVSGTNRSVAS